MGWLIGYNPYFTEGSGDDATRYAYVYNGDGNYYKTEFFYFAVDETANAGWLGEATVKTFSYERINDPVDFATQQNNQNVFLKDADGAYYSNPALVAYYAAKYKDSALAVCELYKRVDNGGGESPSTVSVYPNGGTDCGLYIKYFNKYYRYNPDNPAHWGEPLFFKFTDGYYPASADTATETKYYYDFNSGTFIKTTEEVPEEVSFAVKMPVSADDKYYYTEINSTLADGDAAFTDGTPVYSKRECETVYKEYTPGTADDDPANLFVSIDDGFVPYDESAHAGMTVYERYIGYLLPSRP